MKVYIATVNTEYVKETCTTETDIIGVFTNPEQAKEAARLALLELGCQYQDDEDYYDQWWTPSALVWLRSSENGEVAHFVLTTEPTQENRRAMDPRLFRAVDRNSEVKINLGAKVLVTGLQEKQDVVTHRDEEHPTVFWTHTHYGQGIPPTPQQQETQVREAYREAVKTYPDAPIAATGDEDFCFIAVTEEMGEYPRTMLGLRLGEPLENKFDIIEDEEMALVHWWNQYAKHDEDPDYEAHFGPRYNRGE